MTRTKKKKTEVYVAFQVIPRMKNGNNFELVDQAIEVVKNVNVPYQVSAMETTMKGELNHLLEIVKAAQQKCIDSGALEVIQTSKFITELWTLQILFAPTNVESLQIMLFL